MAAGWESAVQSSDGCGLPDFLTRVCLPHLLKVQCRDGGWGYRAETSSNVEATSWALLGMLGLRTATDINATCERGLAWLGMAQLADGSWPAYVGQSQGCWVTSVASLALLAHDAAPQRVRKAVGWLSDAWPREGGWWWRLLQRVSGKSDAVRQNFSLRGWSWTLGTSSWVEPTALALLLLQRIPESSRPRLAAKRIRLGEAMLYDRMCPGGGWNCGNPLVYGVPGEPAVGPSVWALLALQRYADRDENRQSLNWLETACPQLQGPSSLALAHLGLRLYGRRLTEPDFELLHRASGFLGSTVVFAWAALSLGPAGNWFCRTPAAPRL